MPTYDVACSECGYESEVTLKIVDLEAWDGTSTCPQCSGEPSHFKRVIKQVAAFHGGSKAAAKSAKSHKESQAARFRHSGERDDMQHKALQKVDANQIAAARESVAKGEFEF